jgi:hypothetical protein
LKKKEKKREEIMKEKIIGSRNLNNIVITFIIMFGGFGFFFAGISSYFQKNILQITDTSKIVFIPQGIALLFYGTCAIGVSIYLFLTIIWDIGSGYNEFSEEEKMVKIVRKGFPGKNERIFLSYDFRNIKNLKFLIKDGLNPRCNILLVLKDKREIPLFPAQFLLKPSEIEKKAIDLSKMLNVPLESLRI